MVTAPTWLRLASAVTAGAMLLSLAGCGGSPAEKKPDAGADLPPGLNLYRLVVAGRVGAPPPKLVVANGAGDDDSGRIAPDGNWFAFRTHRSGPAEIWIARKDGTGARRLAAGLEDLGAPSWSPDAKWVVFHGRKNGVSRLLAASPSAPGLREISTPAAASQPVFSRDGQGIYFTQLGSSQLGGGGAIGKLARVGFDGSNFAVVWEGAEEAAEGVDGHTLYFSTGADSGVFRKALPGGKPERVTPLGGNGVWALSQEALFVVDSGQRTVVRIDLKTGHQSTAFPLPANFRVPASGRAFDVAPDETWYLLTLNDNP